MIPDGGSASALLRAWDVGDEDDFDGSDPKYSLFWRFYRLNPAWDGRTWNGAAGIAQSLELASGAYTGIRLSAGGPAPVELATLDGEMVIPAIGSSDGRSVVPTSIAGWAATPGAALAWDAPPERVRVWVVEDTDLETAIEITDLVEISVVSDPAPGIMLGRSIGDVPLVRGLVDGKTLLVTCTVVEPLPLMVGRPPTGSAAVDQVLISRSAALHQVLDQTYLGNTSGTPVLVAGTRAVRDDRPRLSAILGALGPYLDRSGTAEITNRLDILPADDPLRPGAYIDTVEDGRGQSFQVSIKSVVTSRSWSFARGSYGTRIALEPLTLNLGSYV
jgi:hypothetical protein